MSAGCAGDGEDAEGGQGEPHVEEAGLAGTVVTTAQCCDESDINYCFWLKIQQV